MNPDIRRLTQTKAIEFLHKHGWPYRPNRHGRQKLGKIKVKKGYTIAVLEIVPDLLYEAPRRCSLEVRVREAHLNRARNRLRQHCLPFTRR